MISTMLLNQNFWWILLIFQANALNAESDRKICGLNNSCDHWLTDALLFVASPYICTLWWLHLQIMATSLSDPNDGNDFICSKLLNEAGLKTTTATQGDSSWERNVHCVGASRLKSIWEFFTLIWEFTAPWEFCVESIYGSFSPLYGSAAVNALQFGDKVHTLCSADNTSWYVQYQYQYDNTSWYVH